MRKEIDNHLQIMKVQVCFQSLFIYSFTQLFMIFFQEIVSSTSYALKTTLGALGNRKLNIIFSPSLGILKINSKRLENLMLVFEMEGDNKIIKFQKYCTGN